MAERHTSCDLTICSVSYENRRHLEENRRLTAALNPGSRPRWLVVENSPADSPWRVPDDAADFELLESPSSRRDIPGYGSYQHGLGLNLALAAVRTRFALLLDPDFFLVAPDWIARSIEWMQSWKLPFFGAPYYPSRKDKYRHFPCASCMFIDLARVDGSSLDFEPEILERVAAREADTRSLLRWAILGRSPSQGVASSGRRPAIEAFWERILAPMPQFFREWFLVPSAYCADVGVKVFRSSSQTFGGPRSTLVPVWSNPLYRPASRLRSRLARLAARTLLPESLCRVPKRLDYSRETGFAELGLPDYRADGFEEYFLGDAPFAVHFSGSRRTESVAASEVEIALRAVVACHPGPEQTGGDTRYD